MAMERTDKKLTARIKIHERMGNGDEVIKEKAQQLILRKKILELKNG